MFKQSLIKSSKNNEHQCYKVRIILIFKQWIEEIDGILIDQWDERWIAEMEEEAA